MSIPSIEERVDRVDGEEIFELMVEFDSDIVCDEIASRIILLRWVNDPRYTRVKHRAVHCIFGIGYVFPMRKLITRNE